MVGRMRRLLHRGYVSVQEDEGMTTAEYAVGTVAACAFAAVLLKVVSGQEVLALLTSLVTRALHAV